MVKNTLITALIFALWLPLLGQTELSEGIVQIPAESISPTQVVLSEVKEDWFPYLRNTSKTPENPNPDKVLAAALKAEANRKWQKIQAEGNLGQQANTTRSNANRPILGTNFQGNNVDGFPNDNDLAVSKGGYIVSTTNTRINIYDTTGTFLLSRSLSAFSSAISTISGFKYDPRAIYDAETDRFIVAYLSGANSGNSQIIVAFSQSNDPTQGWNVYALTGNLQPNGINVWTDYPAIGISKFDFFVTGNLFTDGASNSPGAGIWQIRLADGYNGNVLTPQVYSLNGVFSLTPVNGSLANYGPNFFLIGKPAGNSGNQFVLYEMDDKLAAGGTLKAPLTFNAPISYSFPPNLSQRSSSTPLSTGDGRISGAFRVGNSIFFTFGTADNNGAPAIYMGHLKLSPIAPTFSAMDAFYITSDTLQFAYPSVTYGGESTTGDKHSLLVCANSASTNHYPGNAVIYVDPEGNISTPTICKLSPRQSPGPNTNGAYRWGDYTDIATATPGVAWAAGYYFNQFGSNLTWISRVQSDFLSVNTAVAPEKTNVVDNLTIYPNPTAELVKFDFSVTKSGMYTAVILDGQGKTVHVLIEDYLTRGEAKVGFNTSILTNGTYYISVKNEENQLLSKPFVVNH